MATSFRKLVNEKCKQCSYDPLDKGTWREQTMRCGIQSCSLWSVRPMARKESDKERAKRLERDAARMATSAPG